MHVAKTLMQNNLWKITQIRKNYINKNNKNYININMNISIFFFKINILLFFLLVLFRDFRISSNYVLSINYCQYQIMYYHVISNNFKLCIIKLFSSGVVYTVECPKVAVLGFDSLCCCRRNLHCQGWASHGVTIVYSMRGIMGAFTNAKRQCTALWNTAKHCVRKLNGTACLSQAWL